MEVVRRSFNAAFETREDESGIITGRPVVLNSRTDFGWFDEVIDSGALRNTDLSDVRLCMNHDTSFVYARSRRNNASSTMQISVDEMGLTFSAGLDIEGSPKAQDFYAAVKRGDIDKMSFMFTIDGYEWENLESDHPTRHITSIGSIFEISAVTFPAYDTTSIEARDAEALESVKRDLERARVELRKTLDSGAVELAKAKYEYIRRKSK